jgi:hypothetical protein
LVHGCKKYLQEVISRVEKMYSETLKKFSVPMTGGDHPELDDTTILNGDGHKKYQMLIGMLNWIVTIGRLDVCYATSSLARFTARPRQGISSEPNKYSGISRSDQTGVSWSIQEIPPFSIARPTSKRIMLVSYKKLTQTHAKKWVRMYPSRSSMSWQSRFSLIRIMHTIRSQEDQ